VNHQMLKRISRFVTYQIDQEQIDESSNRLANQQIRYLALNASPMCCRAALLFSRTAPRRASLRPVRRAAGPMCRPAGRRPRSSLRGWPGGGRSPPAVLRVVHWCSVPSGAERRRSAAGAATVGGWSGVRWAVAAGESKVAVGDSGGREPGADGGCGLGSGRAVRWGGRLGGIGVTG
jgi:hypothetical protein